LANLIGLPKEMERIAKENGKGCQRKKDKKKGSYAPFFLQNLLTKN
jgi:hypothetical protein